jgi:hypothetical protein
MAFAVANRRVQAYHVQAFHTTMEQQTSKPTILHEEVQFKRYLQVWNRRVSYPDDGRVVEWWVVFPELLLCLL